MIKVSSEVSDVLKMKKTLLLVDELEMKLSMNDKAIDGCDYDTSETIFPKLFGLECE